MPESVSVPVDFLKGKVGGENWTYHRRNMVPKRLEESLSYDARANVDDAEEEGRGE